MTRFFRSFSLTRSKFVAVVLVMCLVTRLLLFVVSEPWDPLNTEQIILQFDAVGYHSLAVTLINHSQFALENDGEPEALRTPGYPLYISLFYAVFGEKPWVVLLSQAFLDVLSCMILFRLMEKMFGSDVALYAGLFYALDPHLILYSNHLLSETLFLLFCVIFFYFFWVALSGENGTNEITYLSVSGLFLALATLVRPVSIFLILAFSIMIVILTGRGPAEKLKRVGAFAAVFALTLSPWLIRNSIVFDTPSLSSSGGYNLLMLQVAPFETERRGLQDKRMTQKLLREEAGIAMRKDGLDPDRLRPYGFVPAGYYRDLAVQYIRTYPGRFANHYLAGILHFFVELDTAGYARYLRIPVSEFYIKGQSGFFTLVENWFRQKTSTEIGFGVCIGLYLSLCYVSVAVGALRVGQGNYCKSFLWSCAFVTLYFALITGAAGRARFRLPAIPFYVGFAGIGVSDLKVSAGRLIQRLRS